MNPNQAPGQAPLPDQGPLPSQEPLLSQDPPLSQEPLFSQTPGQAPGQNFPLDGVVPVPIQVPGQPPDPNKFNLQLLGLLESHITRVEKQVLRLGANSIDHHQRLNALTWNTAARAINAQAAIDQIQNGANIYDVEFVPLHSVLDLEIAGFPVTMMQFINMQEAKVNEMLHFLQHPLVGDLASKKQRLRVLMGLGNIWALRRSQATQETTPTQTTQAAEAPNIVISLTD